MWQFQPQLQHQQAHAGEPANGNRRSKPRNATSFDLRAKL